MTTAAYDQQTNVQIGLYTKKAITRQNHYIANHERDWNGFVKPTSNVYNTQGNCNTKTSPYSLVYSRPPPRPSLYEADGTSLRLCRTMSPI